VLHGFSPSPVPRPGDWPDNAVLCGQWIPSALEAFLAAGETPVQASFFGSMTGLDEQRLQTAAVDGILRAAA